ncbi:unnamed protein product [Caenorhabditis auriculariae]|uniref:Uncharacterized protein n=1 Tax=Caenorhabditis auriculariae TaxID=2777116 RepID=A0A8S1GUI1_9PELO|nr:unnamed protein product [Caenorhabditis auriculariae]
MLPGSGSWNAYSFMWSLRFATAARQSPNCRAASRSDKKLLKLQKRLPRTSAIAEKRYSSMPRRNASEGVNHKHESCCNPHHLPAPLIL